MDEDGEIRWLKSTIERAVVTAFEASEFEARVLFYPTEAKLIAAIALPGKPRMTGDGASRLDALRALYLRAHAVISKRHDAMGRAVWMLTARPYKPPVNDPPDECDDPLDMPIDHTPDDEGDW